MGRNTFQRETGRSGERERERMLNSRLDNQTMAGDLRYKARELGTQTDRRMVRKKKRENRRERWRWERRE